MKIFKLKVRTDKNSAVEYLFDMELIQQNQTVVELDGYYETPYEHPAMYIENLIATLQNWLDMLNKLGDDEKLLLVIGIWDEYLSGFYLTNKKLQYGDILDFEYRLTGDYTHNLDESKFHVEYDFTATKEDCMQDIIDNIFCLEKDITKTIERKH
jgi:hypothetical protein